MKALILLLVFFLLVAAGAIVKLSTEQEEKATEIPSLGTQESLLPQRAETFSVGGGKDYPLFARELIVNPFKVKLGETQMFSIWAKDPTGIEKVFATIFTDSSEEIVELLLIGGDKLEGRWEGSWITKNISNSSIYATKFTAQNKKGESTTLNVFWDAASNN